MSTYLTFQKFNDEGLAGEMAELLQQAGIPVKIENSQQFFDPSYANNTVDPKVELKIRQVDFPKAHAALNEYYRQQLNKVDPDYYLFDFTDEELMEIVSKPDEWGHFDYQLAQKLLKERGKEIKPEIAELLKSQRNKDLAKPETTHRYWIVAGYIAAVLGGLLGLIIGLSLTQMKKTLPDGKSVYMYREEERNHGTRILLISLISLIFWGFVRWWLNDR